MGHNAAEYNAIEYNVLQQALSLKYCFSYRRYYNYIYLSY